MQIEELLHSSSSCLHSSGAVYFISLHQRSIDVCNTKHHSTWRTAASTHQDIVRRQHLRSAGCHQLFVPQHQCSIFGSLAFSMAGPAAWNSFLWQFRRDLKTFLFSFYKRTQRIRGFAIMRYISLLLALTLTYILQAVFAGEWASTSARVRQRVARVHLQQLIFVLYSRPLASYTCYTTSVQCHNAYLPVRL